MEICYPFLTELTWLDIREKVIQINPECAKLIDELSPDRKLTLYKISYSFGDLILKNGVLQLPKKKGLISLHDGTISSAIKEKLSYSTIPLLMILQNSNEIFIDTTQRIIPLNLFYAGSILGLFETMDAIFNCPSYPKWNMSAGARTLFMLPKINEVGGYKRLRTHFGLPPSAKLSNMTDHWALFRNIANHSSIVNNWQNEILVFTKPWFTKIKEDPSWSNFYRFLVQHTWNQTKFAIGKIELSLLWEALLEALSARRIKPSPYLASQVKHILLIAAGTWPGIRPADNSQRIAPTQELQEAIMSIYQLKHYSPTLMHAYPTYLQENKPLYYSLSFPTLIEGIAHNRNLSTIMFDLRDIKLIFDILKTEISQNHFYESFIHNVGFNYFHVEKDSFDEIALSTEIEKLDDAFLQEKNNQINRTFCSTSTFWRGCIQIFPHIL